MRAVAVFPEERAMRVVDLPEPHIDRDADVLVEILDVGLCGTDREIARFEYGSPPVFTGVPGRKGAIELDADLIVRNLVLTVPP